MRLKSHTSGIHLELRNDGLASTALAIVETKFCILDGSRTFEPKPETPTS
jgi:hypothetical protein